MAETAREAAARCYRNRAHRGAYVKGARASWAGDLETANPYFYGVGKNRVPTWSSGYHWAWRAGYNAAERANIVEG